MNVEADCEVLSSDNEVDDGLPHMASLRERLANKVSVVTTAFDGVAGNTYSTSTVGKASLDTAICDSRSTLKTIVDTVLVTKLHAKTHCISSDEDDDIAAIEYKHSNEYTQQRPFHCLKSNTGRNKDQEAKIIQHEDMGVVEGAKTKKRKRSPEEIEEGRRKAQERKTEREKAKTMKDAEKQMKKVERETKKQYSLQSCLQYISVLVDTHTVNNSGLGAVLFKMCEDLGTRCVTLELPEPFTITWQRRITQCNMSTNMQVETIDCELEEGEVLAVIPVADFVQMVSHFKQKQRGVHVPGLTPRGYVDRLKSRLSDKTVTLIVLGLEQYFREMKNDKKQQHRHAVMSVGNHGNVTKATRGDMAVVSRVDVEESVTDAQLQTGVCTYMLDTPDQVADIVRRFTKAVAERPSKKDRFDAVFTFHEEGVSGVKVDKAGVGLLKVWKQQLQQFKNVSPDVAQALVAEYPGPQLLRQAYGRCSTEREAERLLENVVVRRGAGVLETTRRIGKELSRRIYTLFNSEDPDMVIK